MDTLTKILGAKISNDRRISAADTAFCDNVLTEYKATLAQLHKWKELFFADLKTNWKDKYSYTDHKNGAYTVRIKDSAFSNFTNYMYFPGKSLETILENINGLPEEFSDKIIQYFNRAYNLTIPMCKIRPKEITEYNYLIDYIFSKTAGLSLIELSLKECKDDFAGNVRYSNYIKISKNRIDLTNFCIYYYRDYRSNPAERYEFNHRDADYKSFFFGLGLFESGQIKTMIDCESHGLEYVDFARKYRCMNSNKIECIKLYKNKSITIYFKTAQDANDFVAFFDLSNLPAKTY